MRTEAGVRHPSYCCAVSAVVMQIAGARISESMTYAYMRCNHLGMKRANSSFGDYTMPLILVVLVLLLLFGGGGFYFGGPAYGGGGIGLILLIAFVVYFAGGFRGNR